MSTLDVLPNECLILVYDSLEDFDEAYSLAQTCRRFRGLFQRSYLRIMRSIIARSETYSYDTRLCRFIDEIEKYSLQYQSSFEPPTIYRPSGLSFIQCYFANSKNLTDAHVLSIIDRWRWVQQLRNLYLRSRAPKIPLELTLQHHLHRVEHLEDRGSDTSQFFMHVDDRLDCFSKSFNYKQTRRFYKALVAYWLAIEARHLARVSNHRTGKEQSLIYELLERLWINGNERALVEAMDMLEVYVFLYEFLLEKILSGHGFSRCWISGGMYRYQWGRNHFVGLCRLHIRPLQIADLIHDQRESVRKPQSHSIVEFAGLCGIFDRQGDVLDGSTSDIRYDLISVGDLERDVELKTIAMGTGKYGQDYANIWACYRKHWDEQTSTVFWWAESSKDVIDRFDRYAHESACLKVHPDFVHLSKRFEGIRD